MNTDQVLIIYSVAGTTKSDREEAESSIAAYQRPASSVRVRPCSFEVPAGASPGTSLGTELAEQLEASIGAVVFVDDLRPNVAYELGFFHGKGRRVLLVTRQSIDAVWRWISDLAGAALAQLDSIELSTAVTSYLTQLYTDLSLIPNWPGIVLPARASNLITPDRRISGTFGLGGDGPCGPVLRIESWDEVDLDVGLNVSPEARFTIMARATKVGADLTAYFQSNFRDRWAERRQVWLGLTSTRGATLVNAEERTLPADRPTMEWTLYTGRFSELLHRGGFLGTGPVDHVERVRLRSGTADRTNVVPVEIGFISIG